MTCHLGAHLSWPEQTTNHFCGSAKTVKRCVIFDLIQRTMLNLFRQTLSKISTSVFLDRRTSKLSHPEVDLPNMKAGLIQWRPKVKDKQRSRHLPLPVHNFRARLRSTPRGCIGTSGNGLQIVDLPIELKESSRQLNQNCFAQLRIAQHDLWISLSHGVRQGVLWGLTHKSGKTQKRCQKIPQLCRSLRWLLEARNPRRSWCLSTWLRGFSAKQRYGAPKTDTTKQTKITECENQILKHRDMYRYVSYSVLHWKHTQWNMSTRKLSEISPRTTVTTSWLVGETHKREIA